MRSRKVDEKSAVWDGAPNVVIEGRAPQTRKNPQPAAGLTPEAAIRVARSDEVLIEEPKDSVDRCVTDVRTLGIAPETYSVQGKQPLFWG